MKQRLRVPVSTPNGTLAEVIDAIAKASTTAAAAGVPPAATVTLLSRVRGSGLSAVRFTWEQE